MPRNGNVGQGVVMAGRGQSKPDRRQAGLRLAADIGGTFTDVAVFDDKTGALTFGKALSTPQHLVEGITAGVEKAGARYADVGLFLHGSTVAINTVLERTGARTALVITEGFRDIYEIGRINRPDAYNLYFKKHVPLVERALRFEVNERILAGGLARHVGFILLRRLKINKIDNCRLAIADCQLVTDGSAVTSPCHYY